MAIEHIVIIVKENHAFDNYFGTFAGANGEALGRAENPPPTDPPHDHRTWMRRAGDPRFHLQYIEGDIPGYFEYARNYTLCDNYFTEVAGPSTPNHLMLICADAPIINNPTHLYNPRPADMYNLASLPMQLEHANLTWGNYGGYAFHYVRELAGHQGNHTRDLFMQHASSGHLPSVSWVYGDGRPDLSEHPKQNVTDGMRWTMEQVQAVVAGGLWGKTVIFITWDDWGGWYDHVQPEVLEKWDSQHAQRPADAHPEFNGDPFRYGSRVGCLVLSPIAKPRYISHQLNSHVSLVRFCQKTFNLPPLNQRDGSSNAMSDCFDVSQQPLDPPSP
jgi:phospholipase C